MEQVLNTLQQGGTVMIFLVLSSIIAVAIIIEKFITLRRRKVIVPEIVSVIENLKTPADIDLALSICQNNQGVFSNIAMIGLKNTYLPREELRELFEDQGRQEVRSLERGIGVLETIAAISPLLGLLGTVIGMYKAFGVISTEGITQSQELAGYISYALITTVVGLAIGIPTLVFYNYFTNKAENLVLDIEKYSNDLVMKISSFNNTYKS